MSADRRRELFEMIGVIAVVASLVILTLEVRQNTNALYAQSRQTILSGSMQELLLQFDNPDVALSIVKDAPLTEEEQIRLDAFLAASMRAREFAWLQYEDDVIDDDQFATEIAVVDVMFDSSRVRQWWAALGREYFSEEFVRFIDARLESREATDTVWQTVMTWEHK